MHCMRSKGEQSAQILGFCGVILGCDQFDVGAKHYRCWHKDIHTQMSCKPIEHIFGDLRPTAKGCAGLVCSKPCGHLPWCAEMSWTYWGTWTRAYQRDAEKKGEISWDLGFPWYYSWCQSQVAIVGWNQGFVAHLLGLASHARPCLSIPPFPSG